MWIEIEATSWTEQASSKLSKLNPKAEVNNEKWDENSVDWILRKDRRPSEENKRNLESEKPDISEFPWNLRNRRRKESLWVGNFKENRWGNSRNQSKKWISDV